MKRRVAAILVFSGISLGLIAPASASPEEISLEEIEADCWNSAVLSRIPAEERETFIDACVKDYQGFLQGRLSDELEYAPPNELEDASTAE